MFARFNGPKVVAARLQALLYFQRKRQREENSIIPDPSPEGKLTGHITSQSELSGSLKLRLRLSGAISSNSELNGTLKQKLHLSGAITSTSSLIGNMTLVNPVTLTLVWDKTVGQTNRTYSNSDQTMLNANTAYRPIFSVPTISGKVYAELKIDVLASGEDAILIGIATVKTITSPYTGNTNKNINMFMCRPGDSPPGAPVIGTGIADNRQFSTHVMVAGDVMQIAYDDTAHTVMFNINNLGWTGTYSTSAMSGGLYIMSMASHVGTQITINGGASSFAFSPPTGYVGVDH